MALFQEFVPLPPVLNDTTDRISIGRRCLLGNCMRRHNPMRLLGIGRSFTCRVGICWIRPYSNPCNFLLCFGRLKLPNK